MNYGVRGTYRRMYIGHCNKTERMYWVPQKLPQIYTVIAYICIGKVA